MKRIITLLLCVCLLLTLNVGFVFAEEQSEADTLIIQTVESVYGKCNNLMGKEAYDSEQKLIGIYYTFSVDNNEGYAIVKKDKERYTVSQLFLNEQDKEYFSDYEGAGGYSQTETVVQFTNRSVVNKSLSIRIPEYDLVGVTCVPNAGANILGFYDRYYDDLIPNFTPGSTIQGHYFYYFSNDNVNQAALLLAADMGLTDPANEGATIPEFKSGMQKYCARKSRTVSFTQCMSWGSFNYSAAQSQLNANKPLILFMSTYNACNIATAESSDTILMLTEKANHAMAGFGYYEVTYTFSNGSKRTDKYIKVATGIPALESGYVNISSNIDIDDAYGVTIS